MFEAGSIFTSDTYAHWGKIGKSMKKFNFYFASENEKERLAGEIRELDRCVTCCLGIGYKTSPKGVREDNGLRAVASSGHFLVANDGRRGRCK